MGAINQEVFVNKLLAGNQQSHTLLNEFIYATGGRTLPDPTSLDSYGWATRYIERNVSLPVNREAAVELYDQLKSFLLTKGYLESKCLRPWEHDSGVTGDLNPEEVWWGFEFETGYSSGEARAQILEYTWDNFDNVCFDGEGEGNYFCEVTFAPAERSKFHSKESDAYNFIKYLDENPETVNRTGASSIGTHINISTPAMRGGERVNRVLVANTVYMLNNSLRMINDRGVYLELFGREYLYAGFFSQGSWMEGKLFRTAYTLQEYENYLRCSEGITAIALAFESLSDNTSNSHHYCSNFVEVLRDPSVVPMFDTNISFRGCGDDTWVNGEDYYEDDSYEEDDYYDDEEEF